MSVTHSHDCVTIITIPNSYRLIRTLTRYICNDPRKEVLLLELGLLYKHNEYMYTVHQRKDGIVMQNVYKQEYVTMNMYVIDIAWKGVLYGLYSHEPRGWSPEGKWPY